MGGNTKIMDKFKQNKVHYESAVSVGKPFYQLILKIHYKDDQDMSDLKAMTDKDLNKKNFNRDEIAKLKNKGFGIDKLENIDLAMLHKLVYNLCGFEKHGAPESGPELQKNLKLLKENRNDIAHKADLTQITDLFIWRKIEELRVLFQNIIIGIKEFYETDMIDIDHKTREINDKLDQVLKKVSVEVSDLTVGSFWQELQEVGKCPFKVKIEIKESPEVIPDLMSVLHRIGIEEHTKVSFLVNKAYFENVDLQFYDSKKYLTPLLGGNSKCKLVWYRGSLCDEMIPLLPADLKQLYVRMTLDQVELLKDQLPNLIELWSLALYLDFGKKDDCSGFEDIELTTLPQLGFKGKQLGLRFHGSIAINNITVVVKIIEGLTKDHQCDSLEFYNTHLNTAEEIEALLQALHGAGVHVTTWLKLQNQESEKDIELEANLNDLAKTLNIKTFKFLNPVSR